MNTPSSPQPGSGPRVALVTGGSRGLGQALMADFAASGFHVVVDARDRARLDAAVAELPPGAAVTALAGDVSDPAHRLSLLEAVERAGGLDVLINNAAELGPSPPRHLATHPVDALVTVYATNTVAPVALVQLLLPHLRARAGCVVNVTSDAALGPGPSWGGYGSSKAALDYLTVVLGMEEPGLRVYAFDPGDMRTDMQQAAFPDEDISDRPVPSSVLPALRALIDGTLPSGRYIAGEMGAGTAG